MSVPVVSINVDDYNSDGNAALLADLVTHLAGFNQRDIFHIELTDGVWRFHMYDRESNRYHKLTTSGGAITRTEVWAA